MKLDAQVFRMKKPKGAEDESEVEIRMMVKTKDLQNMPGLLYQLVEIQLKSEAEAEVECCACAIEFPVDKINPTCDDCLVGIAGLTE